MPSKPWAGWRRRKTVWGRRCCAWKDRQGFSLGCLQFPPRSLCSFTSLVLFWCHYSADGLVFYFLEDKKGTKRISLQTCQAHCSLFRGREWLNLHPQSHSWPTFSLEPENQGPGDDSQSSVSTVGSNLGSGSWVHVGPQLLGSNFRRKGKHAAD